MSKDKKTTINVQGAAIIRAPNSSTWAWTREHRMKSEYATQIVAAYAMNTEARGRFGINNGRQQPHGPSLAGALKVTGRIRLV